jgi:Ni/Co efflux regulator RcnB
MSQRFNIGLLMAGALALAAGSTVAQERDQRGGQARGNQTRGAPAPARPVEQHAGPRGYQRVTEPQGWNARPAAVDRGTYQHNYQAARSYRIGPYRAPAGWSARRWNYGEILPRAYWASQYLLADYWLFALEVPPAGCEWVRYGDDALLVDTSDGEILQVEYGVFA